MVWAGGCTGSAWLGVAGSVQHGRAGPGLRLQRGQGLPGGRHLLVEAGDDTTGRVVLIEGMTKFLSGCLQLLS